MKNRKKSFKEIRFDESFPDFPTFYDKNKGQIYRNIIDVYHGFVGSRKRILDLHITATIDGFEWDTTFQFNRLDTETLKKDIMPYFEETEDYEVCNEIINLHKDLNNKKN